MVLLKMQNISLHIGTFLQCLFSSNSEAFVGKMNMTIDMTMRVEQFECSKLCYNPNKLIVTSQFKKYWLVDKQ